MHIKHTTLMAGPDGTFAPGTEREVSDAEGLALVAGNYAVEVKRRTPEAATARKGETTTAAEQEAAARLANVASAGRGRTVTRKKGPATMTPAEQEEAARDAYAGAAPAPTSDVISDQPIDPLS